MSIPGDKRNLGNVANAFEIIKTNNNVLPDGTKVR